MDTVPKTFQEMIEEMSNVKSERTKPEVNILTIGQVDHGKTTLTAAITQVLAKEGLAQSTTYDEIDCATVKKIPLGSKGQEEVFETYTAHVKYETEKRQYSHVDCPSHSDYVKLMIAGAVQMDAAILVVSALDGPMRQTREHIWLAFHLGIPSIVVFLNKCDMVSDEKLDFIENELMALLINCGYLDFNDTAIIRGSALKVIEPGGSDDYWEASVIELMSTLDSNIPCPEPNTDKKFFMPIEKVFSDKEVTYVFGKIKRGVVSLGDEVEIVGLRETSKTQVTGIVVERKKGYRTSRGIADGYIGVALRWMEKDKVECGQVLAEPGSIRPHTKFKAVVYVLTKEEGGRRTPFFNGYRPNFNFHGTNIIGTSVLPEDVEFVMPGQYVILEVQLMDPIAMENGLRFSICEGRRTVGIGTVSEIMG